MKDPVVLICQYCSRAIDSEAEEAIHWFASPHRNFPDIWIIRCPAHISEWAMRNSRTGRTRAMRARAARGRQMPIPPLAGSEPLPAHFRGADGRTGASEAISESTTTEEGSINEQQAEEAP